MGVHPSAVMALGDGENDLEMLQLVGWGVAMGNAGSRVKVGGRGLVVHTGCSFPRPASTSPVVHTYVCVREEAFVQQCGARRGAGDQVCARASYWRRWGLSFALTLPLPNLCLQCYQRR